MAGDEDELERDGDLLDPNASPEDVLMVEALMGWDGDRCECECQCERFRDNEDDDLCPECGRGDHWPAHG